MRKLFIITGLSLVCALNSTAQSNLQTINFNSGSVNMFDPETNPTPYTINENFSVPAGGPFSWNKVVTIGDSWSTGSLDLGPFGSFGGFSFSASFSISSMPVQLYFWRQIRSLQHAPLPLAA